ncbi:AMP-binding protein [Noviherbaspirillum denitrificans]|uniref:AMP-dependent synthetase n=1 Tax=Noviherbaspirillum denitrificans TaxID=1968433 RepID=A0A254TG08_9BURK|nr:AMP-binding protein [Noviherbaspirillum denitrificans]OWW21544.1 AMP-dependent synthetase [Noviherbaspirillum denitrificans]
MSNSQASEAFFRARDFLQQYRDDYDTAYREYRKPELTEFNWALDVFDVQAKDNHAPALWVVEEDGSEQKISFAEMAARSNRVANYLRRLGVKRGERLLLMLPNRVELWETMLAGIKLGVVMVPTTMLVSPEDLADRLERGAVKHVIAQASETPKFSTLAGDYTRIAVGGAAEGWQAYEDSEREDTCFEADGITLADDPLLLYFTSGTTSKPKLVLHTHQSYPVGHLSTMYWIGLKKNDVHWNISSPGWAKHAWSCFFAPWNAGATVFVYNYARFNARNCLEVIIRCGVTSLCAPPTVWRMMIQEDLSKFKVPLRELVGAGEPLNPEVIEQVESAWGIRIRDGFGQSETTAQVGNTPGQLLKPGSMGRPLPGYTVALLDHDDAPSDTGEISLTLTPRPIGLMRCYEGEEKKTAEVMRAGYYHTGDTASRDEDGYLFYIGRNDDVFKSSDYRISPFELESVLIEHEAVLEAAIVPSPDPLRLSVPKAFITLRAGHEPTHELAQSIFRFAKERLAPYKRIRRIEFAELPKTISGKIRRVELRKLELGDARRSGEYREEDFAS